MIAGENGLQLGAAGDKTLQRLRIGLIVFRHHPGVGVVAGRASSAA